MDHVTLHTYQPVDYIPASVHAQARAMLAPQQTRHDACWGCHEAVRRVDTVDGRAVTLDTLPSPTGAFVLVERGWARQLGPGESTPFDRYREHRCPQEGNQA